MLQDETQIPEIGLTDKIKGRIKHVMKKIDRYLEDNDGSYVYGCHTDFSKDVGSADWWYKLQNDCGDNLYALSERAAWDTLALFNTAESNVDLVVAQQIRKEVTKKLEKMKLKAKKRTSEIEKSAENKKIFKMQIIAESTKS